ncbi:MAG: RdgB/HAM1 family non-canonical purine NTP pyrophosphatase [Woeseia sp.]
MKSAVGKIVLASDNRGKIEEIRQLVAPLSLQVLPQSVLGVRGAAETGSTFRENALLKARHAAAATGLAAIADDSGLEVAALRNRPGVRSARFAGESATDDENIDKLLAELERSGDPERRARFRCVAAYVEPDGESTVLVAEGIWPGQILAARRGFGGFGYDPVFYDPTLQQSAAEMNKSEKNRFSHRGQAFRKLVELIADRLAARSRRE